MSARSGIDESLYPEVDHPPQTLQSAREKADYLHRVCAAWDYGVHPDRETFDLLAGWRNVFDEFPIVTSPAYHALRAWFEWEPLPYPRGLPAPTPRWVHLDRLEGRGDDPCDHLI